ncbi:hypothetical protein APS_2566 [Acetobacter pasteurianus subsp. pasteurianus LMG 1262 = NBRC 106471]|nr:hypothetical protein APS_2566 [Acetobacter pasteurianus subsp. pasteurianus LMG 1262 = NBRC 106471]
MARYVAGILLSEKFCPKIFAQIMYYNNIKNICNLKCLFVTKTR